MNFVEIQMQKLVAEQICRRRIQRNSCKMCCFQVTFALY